jgi:RNA polymerase sigma-70 factor (ECF subfamily)
VNLEEIYELHLGRVYGFFAYRVASRHDAEDLTSATFERAVKHAGRFDPRRASPATWLLAIAQNVLTDHYRRGARRPESLTEVDALDARVAGAPDRPELGVSPELEQALGGLGDREREVVALRFGGDLRGKEIAQLTGLSEANVHQILSRSLRQLRQAMPERRP